MMKPNACFLVFILSLALACSWSGASGPTATPIGTSSDRPPIENAATLLAKSPLVSPTPHRPCGDGVCQGPESPDNCPIDCAEPHQATQTPPPLQKTLDPNPVLNLGIMVHLEGWGDDREQARFDQHVRLIHGYADLFEQYGAKLTLES